MPFLLAVYTTIELIFLIRKIEDMIQPLLDGSDAARVFAVDHIDQLAGKTKLLLLDEVAAGLTDAEVKDIMRLVADLKAAGYSIVWIEHIIETMVGSTDRLMCMAEGRCVADGAPREVIESEEVQRLYLGVDENE